MAADAEQPSLPPHDWLLSVLIPVTPRELRDMGEGVRRSFKIGFPERAADAPVRGYGVFCGRCQLAAEDMTPEERKACRGSDE